MINFSTEDDGASPGLTPEGDEQKELDFAWDHRARQHPRKYENGLKDHWWLNSVARTFGASSASANVTMSANLASNWAIIELLRRTQKRRD